MRNGVFENDTFNGESFRWCPTTDHEVLGQRGCKCEQSDIVNAEVTDLTRRIVLMERMIADFDRMAADLDQGIRIEEDRVKIRDPAYSAYSTYARATALRRDNLRRSADVLRAQLANAKKALLALGEAN